MALLDSLKLLLFAVSPTFIANSTIWIFLANTEALITYVLMQGAKVNYKTPRGAGILLVGLGVILSLFLTKLGSLFVLGYVGVLIFS